MRGGADLGYRSRCAADGVEPHGLDGIDDRKAGALCIQCRQDVAQVGLGPEANGGIGQAQPQRPHLDLGAGFFTRNIQALQPFAGEGGGSLQQQRRFTDAGIAADQDRRSRNEAAAENPVQLVHPRSKARRWRAFGGQIGQRDPAALQAKRFRPRRQRGLFDHGVPGTARLALASPFLVGRAAGGTGKEGRCFGHDLLLPGKVP